MASTAPNAHRPWQEVAKEAQIRRAKSLAAVESPELPVKLPLNVISMPAKVLSPRENGITTRLPEVLLTQLASGNLTSTEVTEIFLRRAAVAQSLTNCITDVLPQRARERASYLDGYLREHGKPIGPLHGLPISVKEHIGMEGLDLNAAFVCLYGKIVAEDALILRILWNAGAVFYVRTMMPQLIMHLETHNNLYGVTVNPYNTKLTPGGSSGGEGALIALGGSVLGIGTDIGGSIRSPAANCGIYGFKPSTLRLPHDGLSDGSAAGMEQILGSVGPMSTSFEGIKLFCKVVLDAKPWLVEPSLIPLPWSIDVPHLPPKLRVAVLWDDAIVKPHPPILRALHETVAKLSSATDIEVLDWIPYKHDDAWEIISTLYWPDGGREEAELIAATGEPWLPLSDFILRKNPNLRDMSVTELWHWTCKRDAYRAEHAAHWNATATRFDEYGMPVDAVDVILSPVGPGAAPPLDCSRYWCYTSQWNLVDYPGLSFPVSRVDQSLDIKDVDYKARNEKDQYNHDLYDPELYVDAPVSLQLVGRRYEEEKVLQAFERIRSYF